MFRAWKPKRRLYGSLALQAAACKLWLPRSNGSEWSEEPTERRAGKLLKQGTSLKCTANPYVPASTVMMQFRSQFQQHSRRAESMCCGTCRTLGRTAGL